MTKNYAKIETKILYNGKEYTMIKSVYKEIEDGKITESMVILIKDGNNTVCQKSVKSMEGNQFILPLFTYEMKNKFFNEFFPKLNDWKEYA